MSQDYPENLSVCRNCKIEIAEVDLFCNHCGHIQLRFDKLSSSVVIISILTSLILFRMTNAIWPIYFLIAFGVIHIYAVVFAKETGIVSAAIFFSIANVIWGVWVLLDYLTYNGPWIANVSSFWPLYKAQARNHSYEILLFAWIILVVWAFSLGRRKVESEVRPASSFFLATGSFILSLWAVWGILIEQNLFREWVFQIAVIFALTIPFLLLLFLLYKDQLFSFLLSKDQPEDAINDRPEGTKAEVLALILFALTAYLTSTQLLTNLVEYGFARFLPKLLGVPVLPDIHLPWLLEVLKWRTPISSLLSAAAIVSLVANSVVQASKNFTTQIPPVYLNGIAWLNELPENTAKFPTKFRWLSKYLATIVITLAGWLWEIIFVIISIARFVGFTAAVFIGDLFETLRKILVYLGRMIRYLVVPVFSFSLLSVLFILILRQLKEYNLGTRIYNPQLLWGESIAIMIIVQILCGAAFGFAPAIKRRFIYAGTESAVMLGILLYSVVSLAALGIPLISFGFQSVGIDFPAVRPGAIFLMNFLASTVLLISLILTLVLPGRFATFLQFLFLAIFVAIAFGLGIGYIISGISYAL